MQTLMRKIVDQVVALYTVDIKWFKKKWPRLSTLHKPDVTRPSTLAHLIRVNQTMTTPPAPRSSPKSWIIYISDE
jgi:hypothetical protein